MISTGRLLAVSNNLLHSNIHKAIIGSECQQEFQVKEESLYLCNFIQHFPGLQAFSAPFNVLLHQLSGLLRHRPQEKCNTDTFNILQKNQFPQELVQIIGSGEGGLLQFRDRNGKLSNGKDTFGYLVILLDRVV